MFVRLFAKIKAYYTDIAGATAVEYGLIAGGISMAIVAAVFAFGNDLETVFNAMSNVMENTETATEDGATSN